MEKTNELINAWAAGLIDGDGCISIRKTWVTSKRKKYLIYALRVSVTQSSKLGLPNIISRLNNFYGGSTEGPYPGGKGHNRLPKWTWTVASLDAEKFLKNIIAYSVGKKTQILTAIEFRENGIGRGLNNTKEKYYQKLREVKNYNVKA